MLCRKRVFLVPQEANGPVAGSTFVFCAEKGKFAKYSPMSNEFHMVPICVETLGAWGPAGHKFIKELGRKISEKTHEKRSTSYIMQNISMEIQRSNSASITATVESPKLLNELFELFETNED